MSWLFSQALVEASLQDTCSDGEPCAQLNVMPTPHPFWLNDKTMAPSSLSRFGLTCVVLTESRGAELLTLFLADFLAKTSARPGTRKESAAIEADCGRKWPESFARLDRDSFSWKTSQRCLFAEWASFSQTWPKWGLMLDGECWEAPNAEGIKLETGYGFWPTLKASDGDQYSSNLDYFNRRSLVAPDLPVIVALSTPPTPKGFYGRLNPAWCEWLMRWPEGWTEFTPLGTDKIQLWVQQHGLRSEGC